MQWGVKAIWLWRPLYMSRINKVDFHPRH